MTDKPTLLETMRLEKGVVPLLDSHLRRMKESADAFSIPFEEHVARRFLQVVLPGYPSHKRPVRLRVTLGPRGRLHVEEGDRDVQPFRRAWVDTVEPFAQAQAIAARHKTTERSIYDSHRERARRMGAHDAILLDSDGFVIEATTANVFAQFGDLLVTPDLRNGGLAGVMRGHILASRSNAVEAKLHADELNGASAIYLSNAVRGLMEVELA